MTSSQWALRHGATSSIFQESLPVRHEYGCVGLRDNISISWCMIFVEAIVLCSTRREEVEKKLRRQGAEYQQKENCIQEVTYIRSWMGTRISIYTEIIWKE